MTLSILIPTFNRKKLTHLCIKSILTTFNQECFEVIVVDDGSTDSLDYELKYFTPTAKLLKQSNKGAPIARNIALSFSKGENIIFLDSDDQIAPLLSWTNTVEIENIKTSYYLPWDTYASQDKLQFHEFMHHSLHTQNSTYCDSIQLIDLLRGRYIAPSAIVWSREDLTPLKGYNPSIRINQDVELLFKFLSQRKMLKILYSTHIKIRDTNIERVGQVRSQLELIEIVRLRKQFTRVLINDNNFSMENRESLSIYLFWMWRKFRTNYPSICEEYIRTYRAFNTRLEIPGGIIFTILRGFFGNEKASKLKQLVKS